MPTLHIIATGPQGSGKSLLVRHLASNPPKGWKLKSMNAAELANNAESWALTFTKDKKKNAKSR